MRTQPAAKYAEVETSVTWTVCVTQFREETITDM